MEKNFMEEILGGLKLGLKLGFLSFYQDCIIIFP